MSWQVSREANLICDYALTTLELVLCKELQAGTTQMSWCSAGSNHAQYSDGASEHGEPAQCTVTLDGVAT